MGCGADPLRCVGQGLHRDPGVHQTDRLATMFSPSCKDQYVPVLLCSVGARTRNAWVLPRRSAFSIRECVVYQYCKPSVKSFPKSVGSTQQTLAMLPTVISRRSISSNERSRLHVSCSVMAPRTDGWLQYHDGSSGRPPALNISCCTDCRARARIEMGSRLHQNRCCRGTGNGCHRPKHTLCCTA